MVLQMGPRARGGRDAFHALVQEAVAVLLGENWRVLRRQEEQDAPWHLLVAKGQRLRVIQLIAPATPARARQASRERLGATVQMPSVLGTMEQWLAHVRPDGRTRFGPYVLNAQRWSNAPWDATGALVRLGVAA
jgi:hypothetical protein